MSEPKKKRVIVTVEFTVELPDTFDLEDRDDLAMELNVDVITVTDTQRGIVEGAHVTSYCTQQYVEVIE